MPTFLFSDFIFILFLFLRDTPARDSCGELPLAFFIWVVFWFSFFS
jgi:hypothetical protein